MLDDLPDLKSAVANFARNMPAEFVPHASYSREADSLYVYALDVPTFRVRLSRHFSILLSIDGQKTLAGVVVDRIRSIPGLAIDSPKLNVGEVVQEALWATALLSAGLVNGGSLDSVRRQEVCV